MSATALALFRRSPSNPRDPGPAVTELLRQLHEIVKNACPEGAVYPDLPEVLLDTEINGIRCLLVRSNRPPALAANPLSPREIEIVRMVAKGLPNKTIAAVLDISTWTVGTHLRRVFAKLGVGSRAAMIAKLAEGGLTSSSNSTSARE